MIANSATNSSHILPSPKCTKHLSKLEKRRVMFFLSPPLGPASSSTPVNTVFQFNFQAPVSSQYRHWPLPSVALDRILREKIAFTPANRQNRKTGTAMVQLKEPEIYYKWSGIFPNCKVRQNLYNFIHHTLTCLSR